MIKEIFKLFNRQNSRRTPLEDFNTEVFTGILNLDKKVKSEFIKNFLELPSDDFIIKTQLYHPLKNHSSCIIDIALIGHQNVCFIESKVNSYEGHWQLLRYSKVLDNEYPEKSKYLFYCTRKTDPKNTDNQLDKYNFKQFKWHDVADFLSLYSEKPIIKDYINFLKANNMAQDYSIRPENLLALKYLTESFELAEVHVKRSLEHFNKRFHGQKDLKSKETVDQIKEHERACRWHKHPLIGGDKQWSEILYGIEFSNLLLIVQLYVSRNHKQFLSFRDASLQNQNFIIEESDYGCRVYLSTDLGMFINQADSDIQIENWFKQGFQKVEDFITQNESLQWDPEILKKIKKLS